MSVAVDEGLTDRAVALHGESCRGLAIGIQAGRLALRELGREGLVLVAQAEHCALDGIQVVTGATPGNRTMVVHDWGKLVYTFYRVSDGRGIRMAWRTLPDPEYERMRHKVCTGEASTAEVDRFRTLDRTEVSSILDSDPADLFGVVPVTAPAWVPPTVGVWVTCSGCREQVLESRTRTSDGDVVCIPCAEGLGT